MQSMISISVLRLSNSFYNFKCVALFTLPIRRTLLQGYLVAGVPCCSSQVVGRPLFYHDCFLIIWHCTISCSLFPVDFFLNHPISHNSFPLTISDSLSPCQIPIRLSPAASDTVLCPAHSPLGQNQCFVNRTLGSSTQRRPSTTWE